MPVTPFHFGPAAAMKAATPKHFSFVVFGLSQVVIDMEPAFYMAQGAWPIHRFFHTYLGATAVALIVAFLGKPLCEWVIRVWNSRLDDSQRDWLGINPKITRSAALVGALFGAYSHVLLDSVMHADMRPLAPLSNANPLLYYISIEHLHLLCIAFGVVGASALLVLLLRRKLVARRETQGRLS